MPRYFSLIIPALLIFSFTVSAEETPCPSGIRLNGECIYGGKRPEDDGSVRFSLDPETLNRSGIVELSPGQTARVKNMSGGIAAGSPDAPLEVTVLFPAAELKCRNEFASFLKYLRQEYADRGLVRLTLHQVVLRDDSTLLKQHSAFLCAARQDKALAFLQASLMSPVSARPSWNSEAAGLDPDSFNRCIEEHPREFEPDKAALAGEAGLKQEPLLFTGTRRMSACMPWKGFRSLLEAELEKRREL